MKTTKRKRRRKRYHTGTHNSPKCNGNIKYRSGWEFEVLKWLDFDTNVISYSYESIQIPYLSNIKTGKMRTYYPDFFVEYSNGSKKLIEVKRKDKINQPKTAKKLKAGEEWCKINGVEFEIWHNDKIEQLKKANKINYPETQKPKQKKRRVKRVRD